MNSDQNIRLAKMHICKFNKINNNEFKINLSEYPERLCVIDESKGIVIDIETMHQYPYVNIMNMQHLCIDNFQKNIIADKRVACIEYFNFGEFELDLSTIFKYHIIKKLIKNGKSFPNGNEELTDEEFLNIVHKNDHNNEIRKTYKKIYK